jgi:hypothetical protein
VLYLEIHLYQLLSCWFILRLVVMLIHYLKCGVLQSFMLCYWLLDVYDIGGTDAQLFLEQIGGMSVLDFRLY